MRKVIVQDIDADVLDILTLVLKDVGYQVFPFEDCGDDFISKVNEIKPDLILLEYQLQGLDCIKVLKQLKVHFSDIPVIAFTTNSIIEEQFRNIGFDDYIIKPFDLVDLYRTLNRNMK
jgi:DNA-binding response OmpR family regulator